MIKETRTIHYDAELAIEAYWLQNVLEPFPDHFHDYYLIGFIEKGARELTCGGQKYITTEGDLFTLNPHEPHGCRSYDGKPFSCPMRTRTNPTSGPYAPTLRSTRASRFRWISSERSRG